ncbi:MAG: TRAP transporter substrate-binding protein DctP [Desulfobacterales bacterium]|nr:MAG: TRAP transporter substrate-binding protein DctP [Desulfobacterales bacterium]
MQSKFDKSKIWGLSVVLMLAWMGLAAGTALSAEKLAIGTVYPGNMTDNEVYPALMYFKSLLEEKTGGAYDVEIFPGGQLGSEVEVTRECQDGTTVQMSIASSGAFSSFYKKYQAIVAPFLFPDRFTAWAFFDSDYFADFMNELPAIGLRYLGTMDDGGGFVVLTNSLRPVNAAADFKGMRVRTEENPAHMAIMNAMGASAVPMAWGEVPTALATKTAHAQFNAPSIISWAKLWETQKYVTFLNHIYNTTTWVVNEKWFKAQSPQNQQALVEAARAAIIYSRGIAAHLSELAVEESKKHGMEFNHIKPENMAELKKLAEGGYRKWAVDEFGLKAELLDSVQNEVARIQKDLGDSLMTRYGK